MPVDQVKIGKFIAERRKRQGLTQVQLAERLGVTQKSVSRWETGRNLPDLSLLEPLSKELKVTLAELLAGEPMEWQAEHMEQMETALNRLLDDATVSGRCARWGGHDMNFVTAVLAVLTLILLLLGGIANRQTIPALVFLLLVSILVVRLCFGSCPACGRIYPFSLHRLKACPWCGKVLRGVCEKFD